MTLIGEVEAHLVVNWSNPTREMDLAGSSSIKGKNIQSQFTRIG